MVVISFVNMKGGVGKTTLAVNIADFLTKRHSKKVLLVDVDPQFNATQCLLNGDDYVEYLKNGGTTIVDIFNYKKSATISVVDAPTVQEPVPYENIHPYSTKRRFDLIPSQLDLFRFEMAPGQGTEHRLKNYLNHIKECGEYDAQLVQFAEEVLALNITRWEKKSRNEIIGLIICEVEDVNKERLDTLSDWAANILNNKTKVKAMQLKAKNSGNMFSWNETIQKLVGANDE